MVHFDPYDYATHDNPYPIYQELRDHAPAYFNEKFGFWIVSRYDDCVRALKEFKSFSCAQGTSLEPLKEQVPTVLTTDPPDHTRLRNLMIHSFTPAAVAPLEEVVRSMARELLTPFLGQGRLDIIRDFAARLPMAIICKLVGVPREDEDMLRNWTDLCVHRDEGVFEMPEAGAKATLNLYGYYTDLISGRAGEAPKDDVVGRLMTAEGAGKLDRTELMGYLYILSIAGNETTTKLIGNMVYQLYKHPEQRELLRRDPSLMASALEETMRFDGPTQMQSRTVIRDIELHGRKLGEGAKVGVLFVSGNRDERKFPDADRYDITRNPRDHIGFGFGLHACMGAALARLEGRIAMEEVLRLLPDLAVEEDGLERMHSPNVRGYTAVPVTFARAAH